MSIELWAARLERPLTVEEETAMLALLPPERRERLDRLRQTEKRRLKHSTKSRPRRKSGTDGFFMQQCDVSRGNMHSLTFYETF